jgi:hypothetical protein
MTIADWVPFFEGEVAAAAALAGLLFVAISINLTRIVAVSGLPERAAITLTLLIAIVIVSTMGLIPDQPRVVFGAELLLFGSAVTYVVYMLRSRLAGTEAVKLSPVSAPFREFGNFITTVPLALAGALEIAGVPGALYCMAPAIVASFAIAGLNAWVLLVEILR